MGALMAIGESRDPRAIPLLRQALLSPDYMIEIAGSMELGRLHDAASIPLIIQACELAPPGDLAASIARGLLDFNTPEAQNAAKRFRPEQKPSR
jgi:HEAT repeat protein